MPAAQQAIAQDFSELPLFARILSQLPLPALIVRIEQDVQQNPCDFVFVYANSSFARAEGFPLEQLIGKKFYQELFPQFDNRELLTAIFDTALEGTPLEGQTISPISQRFFQLSGFQVAFGYCAIILHEISELIHLQNQVEEEKRRLQILLESSIDTAFTYDMDQQVLTHTPESLLRFPALPPEIHHGPQALVDLGIVRETDLPRVVTLLDYIRNGGERVTTEMEFALHRDGIFRWYEVRCIAYTSQITRKLSVLGVVRDIHRSVMERHALEREAAYDALTQVLNVRAAKKRIRSYLEKRTEESSLFLIFDLDDFKGINDQHGHDVGDNVLCFFAHLLQETFGDKNILFRLGGDEFAAFLPNARQAEGEKFLEQMFNSLHHSNPLPFPIRVSVGGAVSLSKEATLELFYQNADLALYEAKRQGKNRWSLKSFGSSAE